MKAALQRIVIGASIATATLSFAAGAAVAQSSDCVVEDVDIADFVVGDDIDLEGYLAAVAAANAVCDGAGGQLAGTGSDTPSLLIVGAGMLGVGAGGVAISRRRQAANA